MNLLYVANKKLPPSDYRVQYGLTTQACRVFFGLPGRPEGVPENRFVPIDAGEGLRLADLRALVRLWAFLRRRGVDYVHFSATVLILLGPYVAAAAGTACLITLTGFGRTFTSERFVYRLLRPLYWLLLGGAVRIAERVLLQNTGDVASMRARYPRLASKFVLVGSGIGVDVRPVERAEDGLVRVLLVARLLPDKGVGAFLAVASRLHGPTVKFVLVGPAARGGDDTLEAVRRAAAAGEIEYLGELDAAGLRREYARAHMLLFPSVGEGMPRVMLEAGFAGLCPVAYDIAANQDLVRPGGGVLVATGDLEGLVAAVAGLAADRHRIAANARAFQRHVVAEFGMEAFVRRMDGIVASLRHGHADVAGRGVGDSSGGGTVCIRPASRADLPAVVAAHAAAFPGFFLTRMGPRFLAAYYRMVLESPEGILLVGESAGAVGGFVAGVARPDAFYRTMLRRPLTLGVPAALRLVTSPRMLLDVAGRVCRLGSSGHPQGHRGPRQARAELASLAVLPSQRRLGLGRRLVAAFVAEAGLRKVAEVRLTTDAADNQATHAFYVSLGFSRSPDVLGTSDRPLTEYTVATGAGPVERAA
jgi:glycosyltransferase involved in cell wall biosynthesis/ribosomal protein S18 acetylase RimI-like enzyme